MKFKIGDRVIAQRDAPYGITTNGWRGRVVEINKYNDENIFVKRGNGEGYWVNANFFDLLEEKEGENEMDVSNIITEEERETLLDQMKNLLDEYDYEYTNRALNKIIDTWANNKKDLITAFKKHPNYLEGKFMIVFSHDFERVTDRNALERFKSWVIDDDVVKYVKENNFMPENMKKETSLYGQKYPTEIFNFLIKIPVYTSQYIDSELYVHNSRGYEICVCEDCRDEYYEYCAECGQYHPRECMTYIESQDDYVCDDCRDGFYSSCEECGEYFRDNNLREHKGKMYCEDCLREILENEAEIDEAV